MEFFFPSFPIFYSTIFISQFLFHNFYFTIFICLEFSPWTFIYHFIYHTICPSEFLIPRSSFLHQPLFVCHVSSRLNPSARGIKPKQAINNGQTIDPLFLFEFFSPALHFFGGKNENTTGYIFTPPPLNSVAVVGLLMCFRRVYSFIKEKLPEQSSIYLLILLKYRKRHSGSDKQLFKHEPFISFT